MKTIIINYNGVQNPTLLKIEDELSRLESMKANCPEEFQEELHDFCGDVHELARDYMEYFNPDLRCSLDEFLSSNFFGEQFLTEDAVTLGQKILKLWD